MNKPTKQEAARARNWSIRQLRALFHLTPASMNPTAREEIQKLIDREIIKLGAESEILREKKREERSSANEE